MRGTVRSILPVALVMLILCGKGFATSTATITVVGGENKRFDSSWDIGPITVSFNGFVETVYYGQYSTPASVASTLGAMFSRDYLPSGLCAHASGNVVTLQRKGTATFGVLSVTNPSTSFELSSSGFAGSSTATGSSSGSSTTYTATMRGGWNAGTYYDSGTLSAMVSGATAEVEWGEGSTSATLASNLASAINTAAGGFVSANSGNSSIVTITSLGTGPATDLSVSANTSDTNQTYFTTPSFTVATTNMNGGTDTVGSLLYSFSIPGGGYAPNGNLLSVTDSVMGQWNYTYDNLNRLINGNAVTSTAAGINNYYTGAQPTWTYDAFGNRLSETWGGTGTASVPTSSNTYYTAASNQVSSSSLNNGLALVYDEAGNVINDGNNLYRYDAEGRLCALSSPYSGMVGYVYDAAGTRVARGSLSQLTCDFNPADSSTYNGFTATTSWVLGSHGEQVTEYAVSSGTSTWMHTNIFAAGALLATYHDSDTYFALTDWLGTKRAEYSAGGLFSNYRSLPFGNGLTSSGNATDATEHHFTGKERDTESGNDYFGARYYASSMGRFMSPDWSAKIVPVPYAKLDNPQSLNLYAYVGNNPLIHVDADGHVLNCVSNPSQCGSDLNKIAPGTKVAADGTVQKGSLLQRIWNHLDGHGDGQSLVSSLVNSKTVTGINPNSGDANGGTSRPGVITYDPAGASITTRNAAGQLAAGWATGATVLGHELIHEYHRENGGLSPGMGDHVFTDGGQTFTEHWRTEEFRTVGFSPFVKPGDITENGLEKEMGQPQRATYLNDYQAVPQ